MKFKTIEEYDIHINDLNKKLRKFKKYVDEHPEKIGVQGNYKAIKHIRDELINERNHAMDLIQKDELNIHINGKIIKNHSLPSDALIHIIQKVTELNYALIRSIKEGPDVVGKFTQAFKKEFCLNVKPFGVGSFNIIFEPNIFSDYQSNFKDTWNEKSFDLLFEILNCGDDLDKLSGIHDSIGTYSIVKYRELLNIIYSYELDVTFEEKGRSNSTFFLKNNSAKDIYNSLKGFDDDSSEEIIKKGILVAVDSGKFRFGFKLSGSNERIDGKYDELLDDLVSVNFKKLCTIKLLKTNKLNSRSGESKAYWELLDIL